MCIPKDFSPTSLTRRNILLSIATFGLLLGSKQACADFIIHHWENHRASDTSWNLGLAGGYYATTSNYDPNGNAVVPSGFGKYSRVFGEATSEYGFSPQFTAFARFAWSNVQLDSTSFPGTAFGLSDQTLGLNYRVLGKSSELLAIDLQAQLDFPAYSNSSSLQNKIPYLGDGSADFTLGAFGTLPFLDRPFGKFLLTGGGGLTVRNSGFSSALPYLLQATYEPAHGGLFGTLGMLGFASLNTDSTSAASRRAGSGGSNVINAINPSLATVRFQVGYQFSKTIDAIATYAQSIAGQASASGAYFSGGIRMGLNRNMSGSGLPANPTRVPPAEYGKSNRGFINYGFEAKVTAANDRLNLVKIDHGSDTGVEVGQTYDIFSTRTDGSIIESIARARVTSVKPDEAALTVTEYYKEVWINSGFIAKRPLE